MSTLSSPRSLVFLALIGLAGPALACSETASHTIGIVGDAAVREGAPAFADGWTVQFEQFVVVVHHPALIEQTNDDPAWVRRLGVTVWDVAAELEPDTESFEIYSAGLRASKYDGFDFRIAPASAAGYPAEAGNVEASVVDAMVEDDLAIHVVGSATDGTSTIAFDWAFTTDTLYRCGIDIELAGEEEGSSVIEIAGERLFATGLGAAAPTLAFAAIADADANADGTVTLDELGAVSLASAGYDANGEAVEDLGAFVAALSRSVGGVVDSSGCEIVED
ncbi:hypothetical protein ACNOYE_33760 [Nannocystaceae bacterium ST9]